MSEYYKVKVKGFDYYDVGTGKVISGGPEQIAMWMLDTDYDGMCVNPEQVFFPLEGKNEGWNKLAKVLKAKIDLDLIEKFHGLESLPFTVKDGTRVAVKIIDSRGIESLKIFHAEDFKKTMGDITAQKPEEETGQGKRRCRVCGCTDDDCHQCIEKTGKPCYWVEEDLCSACAGEEV
jgi:hypothetical protein